VRGGVGLLSRSLAHNTLTIANYSSMMGLFLVLRCFPSTRHSCGSNSQKNGRCSARNDLLAPDSVFLEQPLECVPWTSHIHTSFHARLNVRNRLPTSAHALGYFGEQSTGIGRTGLLPILLATLGQEIHSHELGIGRAALCFFGQVVLGGPFGSANRCCWDVQMLYPHLSRLGNGSAFGTISHGAVRYQSWLSCLLYTTLTSEGRG